MTSFMNIASGNSYWPPMHLVLRTWQCQRYSRFVEDASENKDMHDIQDQSTLDRIWEERPVHTIVCEQEKVPGQSKDAVNKQPDFCRI
jgi:hypothetical protein